MTSKQLRRIFQALVASAPAAWVACGHSGSQVADQGDASSSAEAGPSVDASDDAADGQTSVDDLDARVDWCEAGPPELLREGGCYNYFYVPCGLPDETYVMSADGASGALNRCDQVCVDNVPRFDCAQLDQHQAELAGLLGTSPSSDAGDDAEAGAGAEGGVVEAGPGVYVVCGCPAIGRRPRGLRAAQTRTRTTPRCASDARLGAHFAGMAFLEAASVPAFRRLHAELSGLSAPRALLASIERAIADEERHARTTRRLARRFGEAPARPRVRRFSPRTVEAIAMENAVEGCVREAYGALVATWQSVHASDPSIRRAMRVIATDETRHASLSFRVARFLESRLDEPARMRVQRAQTRAIRKLSDEIARDVPASDVVRIAGMPTPSAAAGLLAGATPALWSRLVSRPWPRARP
jgi:hypothetical protein